MKTTKESVHEAWTQALAYVEKQPGNTSVEMFGAAFIGALAAAFQVNCGVDGVALMKSFIDSAGTALEGGGKP